MAEVDGAKLDALLEEVAGLISGLHVPRSLGGGILGTATPHYTALRELIGDWGWTDADTVKANLVKYLAQESETL